MTKAEKLREMMFLLNNKRNSDKSGSLYKNFLRKTPRSLFVNFKRRDIDYGRLMAKRERATEYLAKRKENRDKSTF